MVSVLTWNVLHRIHAENWGEQATLHHPDEATRIAGVTARIVSATQDVIALQEVSGDQLASLREALPSRSIFGFRYPRVPRPRHRASTLVDPAEYLVTITDGEATQVAAEASRDDPGKGLLAVVTAGLLVVNTHVSYGDSRTAQLARLRELLTSTDGPAIVLGDFNADCTTIATALGEGFREAALAPSSLPTRPRVGSDKASSIDHIFVHRGTSSSAEVEDARGLSDHNLVSATLHA